MDLSAEHDFLSQAQLDQMAANYAVEKQKVTLDQDQWLVFSLGTELFALSMNDLDEIAKVGSGIAIPSVNRHVLGLMSIRGEPILLIDTAQAMGLRISLDVSDKQCVLVLKNAEGQSAGFLVDSIHRVTEFDKWQSQIDAQDKDSQSRFVDAITDWGGVGVSRLRVNELVSSINE